MYINRQPFRMEAYVFNPQALQRIFGTEEAPAHTEPALVYTTLCWDDLAGELTSYHAVQIIQLQDAAAEGHLREFDINGTPCMLTGITICDWYLAETTSHHIRRAPKGFYLLPSSWGGLEDNGGEVPYVEFTDPDFEERHNNSPVADFGIYMYALSLLVPLITRPQTDAPAPPNTI